MMEIERPLAELLVEVEANRARGDLERAAKLAKLAAELQGKDEARARATRLQQRELNRRRDDLILERALEQTEARVEARELVRVREVERELAQALVRRELEERGQIRENRVRALQDELEVLTIRLQELEAEGRHDEAGDIERGIETLRRRADEQTDGAD